MVEKLFEKKVIGIKQSKKAILNNEGKLLYIAKDANPIVTSSIIEIANEKGIDIVYIDTMKKLGIMCDIDVKTAVAVILN